MAEILKRKCSKGLVAGRGIKIVDELSISPDCNSNNVDVSYASTTSDAEFIQDNSDYQWFTEYGYRELNHHPSSILSSGYEELARDLDSQLAQVDMEDYSAQEILSTLPAICCQDIQSERQGEMFASVSGSLIQKLDFDSSISPHTSSQDESSMSLGQSEPLFSPVKEVPLLPTNYSVDSLDCEEQDLMITCQANKHNYTIAFHGSTVMGDASECTDTGGSMYSTDSGKKSSKMSASHAPTTTWSKLKKVPVCKKRQQQSKTTSMPDLAPNLTNSLALGGCVKLFDIQNSSSLTSDSFSGSGESRTSYLKQGPFSLLRLFIAQRNNVTNSFTDNDTRTKQNRNNNELDSITDNAWVDDNMSACYEDSLVRGTQDVEDSLVRGASSAGTEPESSSVERLTSSKSVSICSCSMSVSSHKFNVNNNNSYKHDSREKMSVNARVGTNSGSDLSAATTSDSEPTAIPRVMSNPRCPVHCIDRSMQTSAYTDKKPPKPTENKKKEDKPIYVLYPNYTLPDLAFLRHNTLDLDKVLLAPMKYSGGNTPQTPPCHHMPYRTVTREDVENLKQKGLSHVLDWNSLVPLLPNEYWSMLTELPQIKEHSSARFEHSRPLFCVTPIPKETAPFPDGRTITTSGCSSGTQPSSGYRGSSTLLNESSCPPSANLPPANPLFVYNYSSEEKVKPRNKHYDHAENKEKRFSMYELGMANKTSTDSEASKKRKSMPIGSQPLKGIVTDKEIWEDWWRDTNQRPNSPPSAHALRLDQLIELSGNEQWQSQDILNLRDQVSRFLSQSNQVEHLRTPPNSPANQKLYQCKTNPLDEYNELVKGDCDKKLLVEGVECAVRKVLAASPENQPQVILDNLCPSVYALMSDGLKQQLETPFGPIGNSVWQVVEASAQQGLMTAALNELVMKLNSEDVLSEGLIKFNAFIFGLLNVKGVDTWMAYLRTRESILSKHYNEDALLLSASKGQARCRSLTDALLKSLKPLTEKDFHLDLLYESRKVHESLLQLTRLPLSPNQTSENSNESLILRRIVQSIRNGLGTLNNSSEQSQVSEPKSRPRSCVDAVAGSDLASTVRKRWSGVQVGSRLANAFERLQSDDQYSDSLENGRTSSCDEISEKLENEKETEKGGKFRTLQRKWELLSGKNTIRTPDLSPVKSGASTPKSRIPRPVTSPVRPLPSRLPTPISTQKKNVAPPPASIRCKSDSGVRGRASARINEGGNPGPKTSRPSSLPYRPPSATASTAKIERRAASSSTARKPPHAPTTGNRMVVTLTHRLPSDSGHLAFNEGERLKLVLEVDDTWLLCCRGDQKGLVPRSAVI